MLRTDPSDKSVTTPEDFFGTKSTACRSYPACARVWETPLQSFLRVDKKENQIKWRGKCLFSEFYILWQHTKLFLKPFGALTKAALKFSLKPSFFGNGVPE